VLHQLAVLLCSGGTCTEDPGVGLCSLREARMLKTLLSPLLYLRDNIAGILE